MTTFVFVMENTWLPRHSFMDFGWGNGYVGVTKDHPLFGINYMYLDRYIDIHGGLTFSGMIDNLWCFGFDTAHSGDSIYKWGKSDVEVEAQSLQFQINKLSKATLKKIVWDSKQTKTIT